MAMSKEEIDQIKKDRATKKRMMADSLRYYVGIQSVPAIMVMVGVLVGSAYYLKSEALAVVTGLVSTVTLGLINVLQQMTAPAERPSDAAKANEAANHALEKLMDYVLNKAPVSVKLNDKEVTIGDSGTICEMETEKDTVWGKDKPLKKGNK
jgi:cytochrome c biogenesis protein CcdA